jgi:hypothetical protein
MIVCEEVPRVTVFAVILPHGAPLALAKVGAPLLPFDLLLSRLFQASLFRVDGSFPTATLRPKLRNPVRRSFRKLAGHDTLVGVCKPTLIIWLKGGLIGGLLWIKQVRRSHHG